MGAPAGVVLATALGLLVSDATTALTLYRLQSLAVAASCGLRAWSAESALLGGLAAVTIGQAVVVPRLLPSQTEPEPVAALALVGVVLAGVVLAGIGVIVWPGEAGEALAVMLLGLLAAVARRARRSQALGLLTIENGLALVTIREMPVATVGALALMLLVVVGARR